MDDIKPNEHTNEGDINRDRHDTDVIGLGRSNADDTRPKWNIKDGLMFNRASTNPMEREGRRRQLI